MKLYNIRVLAISLNIIACIHLSSGLVEVKNDKFNGYINGIYQKIETGDDDSKMQEWEFPVNKNRLELLRNDHYVHDTFETCSITFGSSSSSSMMKMKMNQSSKHQVSFTENAKVSYYQTGLKICYKTFFERNLEYI